MADFQPGDFVKFVHYSGDVYRGYVTKCWGPDAPYQLYGSSPNSCEFKITDARISDSPHRAVWREDPRQIGTTMTIAKELLEKDLSKIVNRGYVYVDRLGNVSEKRNLYSKKTNLSYLDDIKLETGECSS